MAGDFSEAGTLDSRPTDSDDEIAVKVLAALRQRPGQYLTPITLTGMIWTKYAFACSDIHSSMKSRSEVRTVSVRVRAVLKTLKAAGSVAERYDQWAIIEG